MMDLRKKIFIISGIVVGLVLALVLYLLYFRSPALTNQTTTIPSANQTVQQAGQSADLSEPDVPSAMPAEEKVSEAKPAVAPEEYYVKQLAGIFVERFLSYSNQNQNQHILDTLSLVTDNMAKWVSKQTVQDSVEYAGVNTAVIASNVQKLQDGKATVSVGVQQVYQGKNAKTEYKSGHVELEKIGEVWKVSGFFWEK